MLKLIAPIYKVIVLSIFAGLLVLAMVSLVSLTPVKVEDYERYLTYVKNSGKDTAQVAGIVQGETTSASWKNFLIADLLQNKSSNVEYSLQKNSKEVVLTITNIKDLPVAENLGLLNLQNQNSFNQTLTVDLSSKLQDYLFSGCSPDVITAQRITVFLPPMGQCKILLKSGAVLPQTVTLTLGGNITRLP